MSAERFDCLEEKMDKALDILSEMKLDVAKNTVDVAHHIKRSDQQDKRISTIERMVWMGAGAVAVAGLLKTLGLI